MTREIVAALLIRSNKILLGHRTPDRAFYPDVWDIFGGHIELGETQAQTLVRELKEELGILATEWQFLETMPLPSASLHLYLVSEWDGEPANVQLEEHERIEWFSLEEAVQLKLADASFPALFARHLI
ncbi:MAG: NUDIX domain-containing protein [Anaerolineales bacterium]|nr:NUDIX domain-containing protein [Anaerolineales bacterium]